MVSRSVVEQKLRHEILIVRKHVFWLGRNTALIIFVYAYTATTPILKFTALCCVLKIEKLNGLSDSLNIVYFKFTTLGIEDFVIQMHCHVY